MIQTGIITQADAHLRVDNVKGTHIEGAGVTNKIQDLNFPFLSNIKFFFVMNMNINMNMNMNI